MINIFRPIGNNYDEVVRECFKKNKNSCISWWIVSSYCYYIKNESLMSDTAFDKLSKWMLDNFHTLEHTHKHLLSKDALRMGTGAFIKEDDYPLRVKVTADSFIRGLYEGKTTN